ncbi:MAG: hypothetical protein CMM12_11890 [Rhodospirillaceae bacterium]|nr:hypothetical protein [Rhodospirillaceae bacterium]
MALFTGRQHIAGLRIDDFDEKHIRPNMHAVMGGALASHQAGLTHSEDVEHLRSPGAGQLFPLGIRKRFGGTDDFIHARLR